MNEKEKVGFKRYGFLALSLFLVNALLARGFIWANQVMPSLTNVSFWAKFGWLQAILNHPIRFLSGLLIYLLMLFLVMLFLQTNLFVFMEKEKLPMKDFFKRYHLFSPMLYLTLICMIVVMVPLGQLGLRLPTTGILKLPEFVLVELPKMPVAFAAVLIVYGIIMWMWYQLKYVFYEQLIERQTIRQAIKVSFAKTTFLGFLKTLLRFIGALLLYAGGILVIYGLQKLADALFSGWLLRSLANGSMILLNGWSYAFTTLVLLGIVTELLPQKTQTKHLRAFKNWSKRRIGLIVSCFVLIGFASAWSNQDFFFGKISQPTLLSHRGVDGENGVQNTKQALEKTVKAHPDLIEIDIQETKDKQFIVLHDPTLKKLAGKKGKASEYTLAQLKNMRVSEDGQKGRLTTFDDYLATAEKHQQRLLVEIKATGNDSSDILKRFITKYGQRLIRHHDQVHSLNRNMMVSLKKRLPKLTVGMILPYNEGSLPTTKVDFYTTEYTTITRTLIQQIHEENKKVYAWTVNGTGIFRWLMLANVDRVITDQVSQLKKVRTEQKIAPKYADALVRYAVTIRNAI